MDKQADYILMILFIVFAGLALYGLFHLVKYTLSLIVFKKYKIDHFMGKGGYYPMVKTAIGWRYINWNGKIYFLASFGESVFQETMSAAELVIKNFHEQITKSTVVSLDVTINDALLKKRQDLAKKYNSKTANK